MVGRLRWARPSTTRFATAWCSSVPKRPRCGSCRSRGRPAGDSWSQRLRYESQMRVGWDTIQCGGTEYTEDDGERILNAVWALSLANLTWSSLPAGCWGQYCWGAYGQR